MKILCYIGIHSYKWEDIFISGGCAWQKGYCRRCNKGSVDVV